MRWKVRLAASALLLVVLSPVAVAAEPDAARLQFESIVQGLNDNSFERFHRATDSKDLTARIFGNRVIEPDVKKAFTQDFSGSIESMFISSFPKSNKDVLGTVLEFEMQGNSGRAVVRYAASGYRYSFHAYDLKLDSRGRPVIVDWVDYYQGNRFSDEAGAALVMALPSKMATRSMLTNKNLGEGELFQMGELFKAVRDKEAERFFQIHDGLDDVLKGEPVVVRLNLQFALEKRDTARVQNAAQKLLETHPDDSLHSLRLLEYYIPTRQYDKAIAALNRLKGALLVKEGAIDSIKASAALAMGNTDDAEKYALAATKAEPSLEVGWWSLLRVRTRAEDYAGATEALTRLEDDFGHSLDPAQLKKDRFLKVLADKPEYLDWRAARK